MASLNNSCGIVAQSGSPLANYTQFTSFAPALAGTTIGGVGTYTVQSGAFCLLGRVAIVNVNLTWTAHTGTGNMLLISLPVTCSNQPNFTPTFVVSTQNILLPSSPIDVLGQVLIATTTATLFVTKSNGPIASIPMSTAGTIQATIIYQ